MNKRYVWNPKTWYQWALGSMLMGVPVLALLWLMYVALWAAGA